MKNFIDYLIYIGILNPENAINFISIYKSYNKSTFDKEIAANSITKYFNSLTPSEIPKISMNITENYEKNKEKFFISLAKKLLDIRKKIELKFFFTFWRRMTKYLKYREIEQIKNIIIENHTINTLTTPSMGIDKLIIDNRGVDRITQNFIRRQERFREKKKINSIKLKEKIDQLERTNCTFIPKLNKSKKKTRNVYKKNKSLDLSTFASGSYCINVSYGSNNCVTNNFNNDSVAPYNTNVNYNNYIKYRNNSNIFT